MDKVSCHLYCADVKTETESFTGKWQNQNVNPNSLIKKNKEG